VLLFESDDRLGGHAHTHEPTTPDGHTAMVDSGSIVHNERTYPNLLRLFRELGVSTQDSETSMIVRCDGCGLEYAGARKLPGLFAQPRNLAKPAYPRMLAEVTRFHRHARRLIASPEADDVTLGAFLAIGGCSRYFVDHFVVPVVSAVWSSGPGLSTRYPARYLFEFLANHGMLAIGGTTRTRGTRPTRSSSPRTPTRRCGCSPTRRPRRRPCSARSSTPATRPGCTTTRASCR
jgi:predicted NAD/FAD-binding protein